MRLQTGGNDTIPRADGWGFEGRKFISFHSQTLALFRLLCVLLY